MPSLYEDMASVHERVPSFVTTMRVLSIDDEPMMSSLIATSLRRQATVTAALSLDEALTLLGDTTFDAIVCDLNLGHGGGAIELHAHLAAHAPELAASMIVTSGGGLTTAQCRFLDVMRPRVLDKPFHPAALRAAVTTFARGSLPNIAPIVSLAER